MTRAIRTALDWSPVQTGINLSALSASPDSNAIPIDGCNQMVLDLDHVNTSGALTITALFQVRRHGDTLWRSMVTKSVAGGVETLSVRQISWAVTGTARISYPFSFEGVDANEFRLATITAVGAAATDTITIRMRPGFSTGG
jgi:hypothetical protein